MPVGDAGHHHVPSTRGRKRKHHVQSHALGDDVMPGGRSEMMRPTGLPSAHAAPKRPYYNSVFGSMQDEELADGIADPLDMAAPRDLVAARYAQNHVLLEKIFGPQRLDMLEPPTSPYKDQDPAKLRDEARALRSEIDAMERAHQQTVARFKTHASEPAGGDEEAEEPEPWAQRPSAGPIVGIAHVPAEMPEEVAAVERKEAAALQERLAEQDTQGAGEEPHAQQVREAIDRVNEQHKEPTEKPEAEVSGLPAGAGEEETKASAGPAPEEPSLAAGPAEESGSAEAAPSNEPTEPSA